MTHLNETEREMVEKANAVKVECKYCEVSYGSGTAPRTGFVFSGIGSAESTQFEVNAFDFIAMAARLDRALALIKKHQHNNSERWCLSCGNSVEIDCRPAICEFAALLEGR